MRLPRRVPWASISELDEVCSWIYANQGDPDLQISALNRVSSPPFLRINLTSVLAVSLESNVVFTPRSRVRPEPIGRRSTRQR
jgi:hypothetical protein